ncbi:MAG: hypothetical protein WKF30_02020 [Pyrinomonadaceae bacterium]
MSESHRLIPALLLLACFVFAPEALADSVAITSGRFFVEGSAGFRFDLRGALRAFGDDAL